LEGADELNGELFGGVIKMRIPFSVGLLSAGAGFSHELAPGTEWILSRLMEEEPRGLSISTTRLPSSDSFKKQRHDHLSGMFYG
jgi:hypothetical protein